MKTIVFTKKLKVYPKGDQQEVKRVYDYIKNGQYTQYLALNRIMSELGTLYYHCNRDFKCEEFQEGYRSIMKSDNPILTDLIFSKGADTKNLVYRKVQADFSTALKNGLAKGERMIPTYKRNNPLMMTGKSISVKHIIDDESDEYVIKWANKINLKVIIGSRGRNNDFLITLLEALAEKDENYKICQSQIYVDGKYIFVNLVVKKTVHDESYDPVKGRIMGVSTSYHKPIVCAFNDTDEIYEISTEMDYIEERKKMQIKYQNLQQALKSSPGGRGRKHKLAALTRYKNKEKNFIRHYNHVLSKEIIELAVKKKTEMIVIEKITSKDLNELPTLLRNWSYYQLQEFITYKAKKYGGIKVLLSEDTNIGDSCCKCGTILNKEDIIPKEIVWSQKISFTCLNCGDTIEYSYNKAKNLTIQG